MKRQLSFVSALIILCLLVLQCSPTEEKISISIDRYAQPDNITCGPTSLRMVMNYYGKEVSHEDVMEHFTIFPGIGVLDPHIAMAAMNYGFNVKIISYNYRVIHPSWESLSSDMLLKKLQDYMPEITNYKDSVSASGYINYLKRGGRIEYYPLSKELIVSYLKEGQILIAALDMEYLYEGTVDWSAAAPEPSSHFVVVHGYDPGAVKFEISDSWYEVSVPNENGHYFVSTARLITAILLGFQVNDADLVIIDLPK